MPHLKDVAGIRADRPAANSSSRSRADGPLTARTPRSPLNRIGQAEQLPCRYRALTKLRKQQTTRPPARSDLAMLGRSAFVGLAMALLSAQLQAAPSYANEKKALLALRADHNRAIAAYDLDGAMSVAADDYVLVGGSSGIERSKAETRKGWAEEFATEGHDRYVRTATRVEVGERKGVLRAAELGRWEGLDHKPAGVARPYGSYFVHWTKATGQWRVVSETYVTLGCRGPGC